jgi:hypothetical protein
MENNDYWRRILVVLKDDFNIEIEKEKYRKQGICVCNACLVAKLLNSHDKEFFDKLAGPHGYALFKAWEARKSDGNKMGIGSDEIC